MHQHILKGTEIYQEIWQEGYEEGYQKGRTALHQLILEDVENRFSELIEMATENLTVITDLDVLKKLARNVIAASNIDQIRTLFATLQQSQK